MPTTTIADIRQKFPQYNDLPDEQLADAFHRKFYSDIPREKFNAQIGFRIQEKSTLQNVSETLSDSASGIVQGATFGFSDEIFAAGLTPFEMASGAYRGQDTGKGIGERISDSYNRALEFNRVRDKQARERSPIASTVGEIAGGAVTAGGLAKGGATLLNVARPTYPRMIAAGAGEGAAYGGAYGLGTGEGLEDRLTKAQQGATLGAVTGGALGGVGANMAQREVSRSIPTTEALKSQAHVLYDATKQSGVVIKPQSFQSAAAQVKRAIYDEGFHPKIHTKVAAALGEIEETVGRPVDFKLFDQLRRVAGAAAKSNEADERRVASIMIDKLDDFMNALSPRDVVGPDPQTAIGALNAARGLWTRMRKSSAIEELIQKAHDKAPSFTGAGLDAALRTEFKNLATNPKKIRSFSDEEQKAIRRVANGGPIESALRFLGKFSPPSFFGALASGGLGAHFGGPIGAVALPAAGFAARQGATAMRGQNAQRAAELARAGGQRPSPQALTPQQRALLDALLAGSIQQEQRVPMLRF